VGPAENAILTKAFNLYQQGRFHDSESLFKSLVANNPNNYDAFHYYGLLKVALGDLPKAKELIEISLRNKDKLLPYTENYANVLFQAGRYDLTQSVCADTISSAGGTETLHHLLALALYKLGRLDQAIQAFDDLLGKFPQHSLAHNEKSVVLAEQGRFEDALFHVQKAVQLSPLSSSAYLNKGNILGNLGRHGDAIVAYEKALSIQPNLVFAWLGRGNVLADLRRHDEALISYDKALSIQADLTDAWLARGNALWTLKRYDEALAAYDRTLSIKSDTAEAWLGRGRVFTDLKRYEEALIAYERALSIGPDLAAGWLGRGIVLFNLNRDSEALDCYERSIALKPAYAEAYWNKALLKLSLGEYEEGWRLYEWRLKVEDFSWAVDNLDQPIWLNDSDIAGKTLLIHDEQGFGDTIQFSRYLDLLRDKGSRVIFQVQEPLVSLLKAQSWNCDVIARGQKLPPFDLNCPLLSLPYAFHTTIATIPAEVPYIRPPKQKEREWSERLGPRTKPRIGLAWSGNPHFARGNDILRPIPLSILSSIMSNGFEWYRLQRDLRATDQQAFVSLNFLKDFSQLAIVDTTALIAQLDLVISIDTFYAHLAGAMGMPVWVLLSFHADFRWLRARNDSPWYPTARLYRQTKAGDWMAVLERISEDLKAIAH
jgi:tetratricopeptide (TPR) repeat protein